MPFLLLVVGIILILKELLPLLKAKSTGVIYTREHARKRVERGQEPERFESLCRNRFKAMGWGLLAIGIGVGWLALNFVMLVLQIATETAA